ncbi:MAG: transglutaminase domain-containing protein [Nitrospirae bacterium]|nr:transglutaminase domain-containing protein [Nitrospirota bacterium]
MAPRSRTFEFRYEVTLPAPAAGTAKLEAWLPLPMEDDFQKVEKIRIEGAAAVVGRDPKYGNSMAYIRFDSKNGAASPVQVTLTADITRLEQRPRRAEQDGAGPTAVPALFLQPSEKMVLTDPIRALARKVTRGKASDLEKVRALYEYVAAFMRYDKSGKGWGEGDVRFCLREARGNCSDFHSLFGSLALALGIPVRFSIGFPLPPDKPEGVIGGYHCWAEAYVAGTGWLPVDISEADKHPEKHDYYFGALDENRVRFSEGRDIPLEPPPASAKALNFFIYPHVEADGRPVKDVTTRFSFRNL